MRVALRRLARITATLALMAILVGGSGCTSRSRASGAQSPPPPTLSAPVRYEEATARNTPTTTAPADEYAFLADRQPRQAVGTSKPLPMVKVPAVAPDPAPVAEKPKPKPQTDEASSGYYIMKKGDTLYGIARKFDVPPKALIAANSFKDPNHLPVGTKVRVPSEQ